MWLEALEAGVELVAILVVGRLCLSVLPPGWPGYHDAREGGATLGASLLLGALAGHLLPYWVLWSIALGLRWLLLPGAMRPRHEIAISAGRLFDRFLVAVVIGALAWAAWSAPWNPVPTPLDPTLPSASVASSWVMRSPLVAPSLVIGSALVLHALFQRLRWGPPVRTAGLALFACGVVLALSRLPAATLAAGLLGASWIVAGLWIRKRFADRRAAWLAGLGLVAALLLTPWNLFG